MAHSIPDMIEMIGKWNKPIKPRNPNKITDTVNLQSQSFKRYTRVGEDGSIIDKPIQLYRMWYRFLQLALELEQKNVKIITDNKRIKYKKPKKDKYGHMRYGYTKIISKDIKVTKSKYKD